MHNTHLWTVDKPRGTLLKAAERFSVNVWVGIMVHSVVRSTGRSQLSRLPSKGYSGNA